MPTALAPPNTVYIRLNLEQETLQPDIELLTPADTQLNGGYAKLAFVSSTPAAFCVQLTAFVDAEKQQYQMYPTGTPSDIITPVVKSLSLLVNRDDFPAIAGKLGGTSGVWLVNDPECRLNTHTATPTSTTPPS